MDVVWCTMATKGKKGEFCMRIKGNIKYFLEEYKKTMLLPTLLLPAFNKKDKSHWNLKDRKSNRFTFVETHD